jgi:ERCC4-related helicase
VAVAEVTVTPLALLVVLVAAALEQVQELMLAVRHLHQDKETLVVLAPTLGQTMVLAVVVALVLLDQTELVLLVAQAAQELHQVLRALP